MTIKGTIASYRKRNQGLPFLLGAGVVLLVVVGIILLVLSLNGDGGGFTLFATKTFTPTVTFTPTITPTITETPTVTSTPTATATATPSAPYLYTIQEGESLYQLVEDKDLGENGLILIYMLNPAIDPRTGMVTVGQIIYLPPPNFPLPTPTPVQTGLAPGQRITYRVMPGDSLGGIAAAFNSTVAAIIAANKDVLEEGEASIIYPGWLLVVPVNLVTAVPSPTPTPTPSFTPTSTP